MNEDEPFAEVLALIRRREEAMGDHEYANHRARVYAATEMALRGSVTMLEMMRVHNEALAERQKRSGH